MYYSSGNYEAFARPRKPAGVDGKRAWFVGSGLASLAGAAFLVRDGRMAGERITILEQQQIPGGALDGYNPWRYFRIGVAVLFIVAMLSTVFYYVAGYYYGQNWTFLDCLFMVVITLSTIGYGDWLNIQQLHSTPLLVFTMLLAMAGMGVPAFIISNVTALIVDGIFSDTVRRRRMQQEIAKLEKHVIVCGAGGTGEHCISELVKIGRKFVVIDGDVERIKALHARFDQRLVGLRAPDHVQKISQRPVQRFDALYVAVDDNKFPPELDQLADAVLSRAAGAAHDHVPVQLGNFLTHTPPPNRVTQNPVHDQRRHIRNDKRRHAHPCHREEHRKNGERLVVGDLLDFQPVAVSDGRERDDHHEQAVQKRPVPAVVKPRDIKENCAEHRNNKQHRHPDAKKSPGVVAAQRARVRRRCCCFVLSHMIRSTE